MNKGKFSFNLSRSKEKKSESLGNIFEENGTECNKNESSTGGSELKSSDDFQSMGTIFEYNKSVKFYNEHPELLDDFVKPNKLERLETKKEIKKEDSKKASLGRSKYLSRIQEYVELRNIERQEIQEEKIQKEIQEEEDTQVFITDSYKNILDERKKLKDSLTKRKLTKDEDSKLNGPSSIFEMRFSTNTKLQGEEEIDNNITHVTLNEEININNANLANKSTIQDSSNLNNDNVSKSSNDLKQIKIQQARQRYLLRKEERELLKLKNQINP